MTMTLPTPAEVAACTAEHQRRHREAEQVHATIGRHAPPIARPLVTVIERSGGLGLGMLALASGDLDTGGRVPSIDQLRRAGDLVLERRR